MSKLWVLPLEPLEMRYTKQWHDWFYQVLEKKKIDFQFIYGKTQDTCIPNERIETGEVLDVYGTNIWKLTQLAKLIEEMQFGGVQNGDKIFTFDMWHTGLEAIQYVKSMTGLKVDLYGIWHAGSYDHSDFTYRHGFEPWAFKLEQVWGKMAKKMFVGSMYHQKMISNMRGINTIATGLPINVDEIRKGREHIKKKNIVIVPSRLDPEKRIDKIKQMEKALTNEKMDVDVEFLYTHEHNFSKQEYYNKMAEAKVVLSAAEHENFGIGVIEGMALGCFPVVPKGLSYSDYVPDHCMYPVENDDEDYCLQLIMEGLHNDEWWDLDICVRKYEFSFEKMLREMGY